jgi:hypothetical protein
MHKLDKPPQDLKEGEWKWAKRGMGTLAVGVVLGGGGLTIEHFMSDNFIEVSATQREELSAVNHQLLTRFSTLPFDAASHAEKTVVVEGNPDYKNTLEVQLSVEGDKFVIDGEGHHIGVTKQSQTHYDDPASFHLSYQLDQDSNVHTVPAELLEQVMESGQMPSEIDYQLTETRPGYGRYDVEDGLDDKGTHEDKAVLRVDSSGELTAIQVGEAGSTADNQDLTDRVKKVYADIIGEIERVGV